MLKTVFMLPNGMVAAFDENAEQVGEAQGRLVDFFYQLMQQRGFADALVDGYYQLMKERGLADERTEFNWHGDGIQQATGADLDQQWRSPAEEPT